MHQRAITTDAWHDGKPFHFSPEPEIFSTDFLFFLPLIILGSMFLPTLAGALALYGSMPALHSNIRRPLVAMRLVDHTPPPTANVDHAAASVSRLLSAPRSQNLPKLDEADHEVLESGSMLMRTYQTEGRASEGFAVQVVQAPAEHIWQSILDWDEWPRMVDDVCETEVYETHGDHIKVKVTLGIGPLRIKTHVHHELDRAAGRLTWKLDPDKKSDLLGNRGFWAVVPATDTSSTVYYSVSICTHKWAPGWLNRHIEREGFPRALSWLKEEAEARFAQDEQSRV